jgi:hypothetical protein
MAAGILDAPHDKGMACRTASTGRQYDIVGVFRMLPVQIQRFTGLREKRECGQEETESHCWSGDATGVPSSFTATRRR